MDTKICLDVVWCYKNMRSNGKCVKNVTEFLTMENLPSVKWILNSYKMFATSSSSLILAPEENLIMKQIQPRW